MDKAHIISQLKAIKPELVKNYAIKNIGLYGSYIKNSYNSDSDIDILIELGKPLGWNFFDIQFKLEGLFNKRIDLVTKKSLRKELKENILKEVVFV